MRKRQIFRVLLTRDRHRIGILVIRIFVVICNVGVIELIGDFRTRGAVHSIRLGIQSGIVPLCGHRAVAFCGHAIRNRLALCG